MGVGGFKLLGEVVAFMLLDRCAWRAVSPVPLLVFSRIRRVVLRFVSSVLLSPLPPVLVKLYVCRVPRRSLWRRKAIRMRVTHMYT